MMQLQGLSKSYDGKTVIDKLSLSVEEDEYLTILGPSGSGKTTLLRLIAGLEKPDTGSIRLNEVDIGIKAPHARGLGFVQQKYALFPHLSVFDNVAFGLRYREASPLLEEKEIIQRVNSILSLIGLDELNTRMVGQISGGQKQRVSLARTLVVEPKVCLLDEPLGALDANLRERMTTELRRIREALNVTFVHATGNEAEAMAMGDRVVVLGDGRMLQLGAPETIYGSPATVAVARSVNAYNLLNGEARGQIFCHADTSLPLSFGHEDAHWYAIRFGAIEIANDASKLSPDFGSIPAKFVASEFIGSRMAYFFHGPDGGLLEVEQHLSKADPIEFQRGDEKLLAWNVADVLTYDRNENLIAPTLTTVAA